MLQLGAVDLALGGVAGDLHLQSLARAEHALTLHQKGVSQMQVEAVARLARNGQGLLRQGLAEIGADQIDRLDVARLGLTGAGQFDIGPGGVAQGRYRPAGIEGATAVATGRNTVSAVRSRTLPGRLAKNSGKACCSRSLMVCRMSPGTPGRSPIRPGNN